MVLMRKKKKEVVILCQRFVIAIAAVAVVVGVDYFSNWNNIVTHFV